MLKITVRAARETPATVSAVQQPANPWPTTLWPALACPAACCLHCLAGCLAGCSAQEKYDACEVACCRLSHASSVIRALSSCRDSCSWVRLNSDRACREGGAHRQHEAGRSRRKHTHHHKRQKLACTATKVKGSLAGLPPCCSYG